MRPVQHFFPDCPKKSPMHPIFVITTQFLLRFQKTELIELYISTVINSTLSEIFFVESAPGSWALNPNPVQFKLCKR